MDAGLSPKLLEALMLLEQHSPRRPLMMDVCTSTAPLRIVDTST